jgi:PPOX class probable F420-dependent enzyme
VRRNLAVEELGDLLEQPLLAVLATYRRDGSVLLSPVWHEWHEGGLNIVSGSHGIKAKHLRRDPRAAVVVCEHVPPYRGLELHATPKLVTDGVAEVSERIATRFLGPEKGAKYAEESGDDLLIRLEPGKLRTWDFADEFDVAG